MDLLRRIQKAGRLIPYQEAKDSGYLGAYYRELGKGIDDSKIFYRLKRLRIRGYISDVHNEGSRIELTEKGLNVLRDTISVGVCSGRISMSVIAETGKKVQLKVNTDGITAIEIDNSRLHLQGVANIEVSDRTRIAVWIVRPEGNEEQKERKEDSAAVQVVGGTFRVENGTKPIINAWSSGTYSPRQNRFGNDQRGGNSDKFFQITGPKS